MLMNPAASCRLSSFVIGITKVCFMAAPVGNCKYCCPRDDAVDIQFILFTSSSQTTPEIIPNVSGLDLNGTSFNLADPTVIYLMGFSEATDGSSTTTLRDAYLSTGSYNFIAVDWARLIAFPWYLTAVRNTRYMGQRLAIFIRRLQGAGVSASSLHIIGFSLGAEAAGFTGKLLRRRGIQLGRITGLDPAYPGYTLTSSDGHLARGDASFVDVIHTNPGVFGFPQAIGDVDFYPNPGSYVQAGCWLDQLFKNKELAYIYGCSHNRAWRLYSESVRNPAGFPATLCRRWRPPFNYCRFSIDGYMGFGAQPQMTGKMYLETNEKSPFAKNGP